MLTSIEGVNNLVLIVALVDADSRLVVGAVFIEVETFSSTCEDIVGKEELDETKR